jgi:hypothetical protein
MPTLRGLRLDEFSIVQGSDKAPANPEATVLRYKTRNVQQEQSSMKKSEQSPPAAEVKKSLAQRIGEAVQSVMKTVSTRTTTNTYSSTSNFTEDVTEDDGLPPGTAPPPEAGEPEVTVVVAQTRSTNGDGAEPASSDDLTGALTKALEPIAKAVAAIDLRVAKMEAAPVGSQAIRKSGAPIQVTSNSQNRFPEFTKFLRERSGLTAGQRLTKATISTSGWSYGLSTVEAGAFIDYIVDQSVLLKLCRTIQMPNAKFFVDKIGLGGNVLVKGTPGTDPGDTVSLSGPTQVPLTANEVLGIASVGDDTLEDNIEGDAFVQHLLGMMARSAANELEQAGMHGDTGTADSGILDRWDGWYKLAKAGGAHCIEGMADTDRYWPGTAAAKATKLIKALPVKYRLDFRNLAVILANDLYLDYNDELATKGYSDAWQALTGMSDLPVRGIKNVRMPMLKTNMSFSYSSTPYTNGTMVMLTDLRNLLFGIHRDIKLEPFRQPRKRCTDYVLSMRAAVNIENCDAISIYDHALVKS